MKKLALLLFVLLLVSCHKSVTIDGISFTIESREKNLYCHVITSDTVDNPDILKKSISMLGLEKCNLVTFENNKGVIFADMTKMNDGFYYFKHKANSKSPIYFDTGIIHDGTKCAIISEEFVKSKLNYPLESKFRTSTHVHEVESDQAIILNKFTTKNAFGVTSEYVYKIWMNFNGGEWEDINNWSYSKLIIENTATGEKQHFNR